MFDATISELPARSSLPDLGSIPAGPELVAALDGADRDGLSGYDRVELLKAHHRLVSHYQAELQADMVSVYESELETLSDQPDVETAHDLTVMEVGTALCWTRRAAESQLELAFDLVERLPRVWDRLHTGIIDLPRVRVIADQTMSLDSELRTELTDQMLVEAEGLTTGQLRARLARLVIIVDPESAQRRYLSRKRGRLVHLEAEPEGTAALAGRHLDSGDANKAMRRLDRLARTAKRLGDPRSLDQLRADLLLDLLIGRTEHPTNTKDATGSGGDRGVVDIRVDLTTLAGLDEKPGEIPGWGPVIADITRQLVEEQQRSQWKVTVTDPDTGMPVAVTTTKRRPNAIQRRIIEAFHPTCVFPGCRIPFPHCDIDHEQAWAQTHRTTSHHSEPLCRFNHRGKHSGWKLKQIRPGIHQWTSPLGHIYINDTRPR